MLQWEWFRIYFESGLVKILSGEEQWRNLTAMDKYYENGPLPSWIGWYVQQWPHSFHAFSAGLTLIVELFVLEPEPTGASADGASADGASADGARRDGASRDGAGPTG